jgi:hypothetical protein
VKKLILLTLLLLVPIPVSAQDINLGVFGDSTYYLQPESVRFCSTISCIYIDGQDQPFVGAVLRTAPTTLQQQSGTVLTYNNTKEYELKTLLLSLDGTRFVLLSTASFDVNGNLLDVKNETVEKITLQSSTYTETINNNGGVAQSREKTDVERRKIVWLSVIPGTSNGKIISAILDYANSNYRDVLSRSQEQNSMQGR